MIENLYTQLDINNINSNTIKTIRGLLPDNQKVSKENFTKEYIFDNLSELLKIYSIKQNLSETIFASKGSLKWYRIIYDDAFIEENLLDRLKSLENYNKKLDDLQDSEIKKNSIIGIVKHDNVFILKILFVEGHRKLTNGVHSTKEEILKVAVVKMDTQNKWLEIRASQKHCEAIKNIIEAACGLNNRLKEIDILDKYNNDVEKFKNDLKSGFYLTSQSIPAQNITLTLEDANKIKKIFKSIDKYMLTQNIDELGNSLEDINLNVSLGELMLAGLDSFDITIKNSSKEDISKQAFYSIFKEYTIENISYLKFLDNAGYECTIQIGIKTNTIRFMSNTNESTIKYIRNKIV